MKHLFIVTSIGFIATAVVSGSSLACGADATKTGAGKVQPPVAKTPTPAPAPTPAPTPAPAPTPSPVAAAPIAIEVTSQGFSPNKLSVKRGVPVTLVFNRTTDKTCAKEVVIAVGDGTTIERALPLKQKVEIAVTFAKAGELSYACKMDMVTGIISVQ
jgi:plastocyanin